MALQAPRRTGLRLSMRDAAEVLRVSLSACISSRAAPADHRSSRRKFLRVLHNRYFRELRVVAWNDNANNVSVLVRRFDDEGLRRFVGVAEEGTHEIAPGGTIAQFQLYSACQGREYPEVLHRATRAIVCGRGQEKKRAQSAAKNVLYRMFIWLRIVAAVV